MQHTPSLCRVSHGLQPRGVHPKMQALKHLHLVALSCHVMFTAYSKRCQSFRPEHLDCSKLAPLQRRVQTHGCQKPTAPPSAPLAAVLLANTAHRCLQLRLPCSTPPQVCRHSHGLQPRGVHPKMPALKHLHLVPLQCHVLSAAYSKQWQSFQQTGPSFLTAHNSRLCSASSAPCAAAKI